MLRLKIAGQYVDLPGDFSFTMNMKSPVFEDVGNYSYPFRIPATSRNSVILGFPHRVENTADVTREFPCVFEWNGLTLFAGTARLKTTSKSSYEGVVFEGTGSFFYAIKNRYLHQVDMGGVSFESEQLAIDYLNSTLTDYYPAFPITCPIICNKGYFDPPTEVLDLQWFNLHPLGGLSPFSSNGIDRSLIVPHLYLRYVLDKLSEGLGFQLNDSFFNTHPDFSRLILSNTVSCNNTGTTNVPKDTSLTNIHFNLHLPRLLISDFIKGLETFFGISFIPNIFTQSLSIVPLKNIVLSDQYKEFSKDIISIIMEVEERKKGFTFSMKLDDNDEAPGWEFVKTWDEGYVSRVKGSVKSLSDLPPYPFEELYAIYYVEDESEYYIMDNSKTWVISDELNLLGITVSKVGDGSEKIETIVSTPLINSSDPNSVFDYAEITNPMTTFREVMPRLLFAEKFIMPVTYVQIMIANNETEDFTLLYSPDRNKNMIGRFWMDFLNFKMAAPKVKITKSMNVQDIRDLDFSAKYMINGSKYLIKSIQLTIKADHIMPAQIEAYLCN